MILSHAGFVKLVRVPFNVDQNAGMIRLCVTCNNLKIADHSTTEKSKEFYSEGFTISRSWTKILGFPCIFCFPAFSQHTTTRGRTPKKQLTSVKFIEHWTKARVAIIRVCTTRSLDPFAYESSLWQWTGQSIKNQPINHRH